MSSTIKSKVQASGHQNPHTQTKKSAAIASVGGKTFSLLSPKTKLLLKKLLLKIARHETSIELKRQYLAANEIMEPYSAF
jgi:hypothetical protein